MEKARGYITGKIGEGAEHVAATQGNGATCDLYLVGRPLILEDGTESLVLCFCVLMYQSVGEEKSGVLCSLPILDTLATSQLVLSQP